ncbi:MAG: hypothetical protein J2P37_11045, partial [Ktedonobacteraceae bacterium]|nr:hypothetical protein [Ktedonobacteraceae bacterium]
QSPYATIILKTSQDDILHNHQKSKENQRMNKAKRVAWQKHRIKAKKRKEKQRQEQKAGMAASKR